jgi:glycosyltransferase involved in cell wall biosynthesis
MSEPVSRKVAIISGLCVRNDAISASVRDDALSLSADFGFHSRVFTHHNEFPDVDAVEVGNASEIVFDQYFLSCDLIIYHFGIFHELFNVIFLGNGLAPQAVRYHNLTPRDLLTRPEWAKFERSSAQLYNLAAADAVWPVSELNRLDLLSHGFVPEERVRLVPLSVGDGKRRGRLSEKQTGTIQLLFVGRVVRAKGVMDLLRAAVILRNEGLDFVLRIVGDMRFSDLDYVDALKRFAQEAGFGGAVTFVGGVNDSDLDAEYSRAHILVVPSYHEGFCKPVIEALRFGCLPVTYASSNLALVARGLSRTVPSGEAATLAAAIAEAARAIEPVLAGAAEVPLPVDRGSMPVGEYERAVDELLAGYGFPAVSEQLRQAAKALLARSTPASLRINEWASVLQANNSG